MKTLLQKVLVLCTILSASALFAQGRIITGTVTEANGPLPGATVVIKGTSTGTQTDFDGNYSIEAASSDVLSFSYVGYKTLELAVGSQNRVNAELELDNSLDEVIITGYNTYTKDQVTSAVSTVSPKAIEQVPIASIDQVLQGRVAGVNVGTASGQPGQSATIRIRGAGSFSGDTEPLFVIDGVFVDQDNFRSLNANDIANISVLKDASASALYGSRAAGGVIVITTKRGTFNSPLKVNYRTQYGISSKPVANFDVLNSQQLLEYQRNLGVGAGANLSDEQISELAQVDTNWSDLLFRDGVTQSHEINFSKGTENSRNYTSLGYFEQEGITQGSALQRFTFRTNNEVRSDKLSISTNLTANFSKSDFIVDAQRGGNTGGQLDNPFITPFIGLPFLNPFNEDGSLNTFGTVQSGALNADGSIADPNGFTNTPFLGLNSSRLNTDNEEEFRIIGSLDAKYEIIKNVKIGTLIGLDYLSQNNTAIISPNSIRGLITPTADADVKGSRTESDFRDLKVNINTSISYNNTFNDVHKIGVSLFTEYNKRHIRSFGFQGFGLNPLLENSIDGITNGTVVEIEGGAESRPFIPTIFGGQNDRGLFSVFGVLNYAYSDKYNFQASLRRDGSSFFPDEFESGTFGAVSARWNIHNEDFWGDNNIVKELSLRASYGTVGNQELFIPFGQFNLFSSGIGYNSTPAIFPSALGNDKLKWEETEQINIGIDFSLFQDGVVYGSLDVYNNTTTDALLNRPISLTSGFASFPDNVGSLRNRGVDLEIGANIISNPNDGLNISVFANGNYNDNEILELIDDQERVGAFGVGQSLGEVRTVRYAGVNPSNGRPLYFNADGDVVSQFNGDDAVFTGKSTIPTFSGGFGSDISYKGFDLNFLWSFAADQYRFNNSLAIVEDPSLAGFANQATTVLNAWQQPGDITDVPDASLGGLRAQAGDRYLEDASFLRLRNVILGYNIDSDLIKSNLFTSARIYVQAQNLVTITKFRGFDPENNGGGSFFDFPTPKSFTVGFDLNF